MAYSTLGKIRALAECSLCLSAFDKPKTLPCIHTFCLNCLKNYVENETSDELRCPLCRAEFTVPKDGVEGFPNNFFVENILEYHILKEQNNKETELQCSNENIEVVHTGSVINSPEWDQKPCRPRKPCVPDSKPLNTTKLHETPGLHDRNKTLYRNCNRHTMRPLNRRCLQCDMAICMECLITEHNGHRSEKIEEAAARWVEQLNSKHIEMESRILSMPDLLKKGDALHKSILDVGAYQRKRITDRCDRLCELIDKHKNELINELSKGVEASANKVKSQMDEISSHKELMESHANMLQEMNTSGSSSDVFGKSEEFLNRVDDLLGKGIQLKQRDIQKDKYLVFHAYEDDDVIQKKYIGRWNSERGKKTNEFGSMGTSEIFNKGRILYTVGLDAGGSEMEQKIFEISLNKPDTINVINSTPTYVSFELAACVVSNVLYAVGFGSAYRELWKWSASRDEWTRCADMPSGRRRHCVTSVGDKIYVLGGWIDAEQTVLDDILCYDINSNDWTQAEKLRHAVMHTACETYKHYAYAFGGKNKEDELVDYVQIYDTVTCSVSLGSNPMPRAGCLMRAVGWKTKALLIGCNSCFIYDFEFDTWQERERFKTDMMHFGLTLDDNILYISGGGTCSPVVWTCTDKVKSLLVEDFILDNEEAEWKHYATLPTPGLIHLYNTVTLLK